MKRVVADTTVLRYLIMIETIHVLPALFDQVIVPPAVVAELQHPHTPARVRAWVMTLARARKVAVPS